MLSILRPNISPRSSSSNHLPSETSYFFYLLYLVLLGAKQNSWFPGTGLPIEVKRTVLGTVVIRRHLGGHLRAQNHTSCTWPHDNTQRFTCHVHFLLALLRLICFNTIQLALQHTRAEDGYLKRPHPPNNGGDILLDWWLVCGRTWGWRTCDM